MYRMYIKSNCINEENHLPFDDSNAEEEALTSERMMKRSVVLFTKTFRFIESSILGIFEATL